MARYPRSGAIEIKYNRWGRMLYHPDFHGKQGTDWTTQDQQFLIDNYYELGPEQLSFELERTIGSIMTRAGELREQGLLIKPSKKKYHKRMKPQATQ